MQQEFHYIIPIFIHIGANARDSQHYLHRNQVLLKVYQGVKFRRGPQTNVQFMLILPSWNTDFLQRRSWSIQTSSTVFLATHEINLHYLPLKSSNKLGWIDLNNGSFSTIINKIKIPYTTSNAHTHLARSYFLTNLINYSKIINAFQMVRGCTLSIHVMPRPICSQEQLNAHIHREATRAMARIMRSETPNRIYPEQIPTVTQVLLFYKISKNKHLNKFFPSTFIRAI